MLKIYYDRIINGGMDMNKTRRQQIDKAIDMLQSVSSFIEQIKDDEECYMENMPENLQGSMRYSDAEEACSHLEDAIGWVESAIEDLENAKM